MNYLIVNALPEDDVQAMETIRRLSEHLHVSRVIHTAAMKIHACIGCNDCWLKTPGVCCIKDDYEQLLIAFLQADRVLFLAETRFGFVSSSMKNLMDRILPLATIYLTFRNGQMRHYPRYHKHTDMGLLYRGEADHTWLNHWMDRAMLNLHAGSLGAYDLNNGKEYLHAFDNH